MAKQAYKSRYNSDRQGKGCQFNLCETDDLSVAEAIGQGVNVHDTGGRTSRVVAYGLRQRKNSNAISCKLEETAMIREYAKWVRVRNER